jgi:hypothetical protein
LASLASAARYHQILYDIQCILYHRFRQSMIHAGISELCKGFQRNWVGTDPAPKNLLLFYAAECALKAVWLRRNRLRTTEQIETYQMERGGHDLMYWAMELRLPATLASGRVHFRIRKDSQSFTIAAAHQAWRYGIAMHATDEEALVKWLTSICEWARQELSL